MKLRIDDRVVNVLGRECRWLDCLWVGHATHHSAAGASGCSSWTDDSLSCCRWYERGCPPSRDRRRREPRSFHAVGCAGARYDFKLHKRSDYGTILCRCCGSQIPRWAAFDETRP